MKTIVFVALFLLLLLLWRAAWRTRPILAFGITLGLMIGWVAVAVFGVPEIESVPVWLPPLPFAVVAVTLFVFGVLAWVWGDEREAAGSPHGSPPGERQQH
jgi:hypothetical protein